MARYRRVSTRAQSSPMVRRRREGFAAFQHHGDLCDSIGRCLPGGTTVRASFIAPLVLAVAGGIASGASSQGASATELGVPRWKVAYEHYDSRLGEGGAGIDVVTSERRTPRALTRRPPGSRRLDLGPVWSPDGRYTAFFRSGRGLHVIREDGRGLKRVASNADFDVLWSPDGTMLAFVRDCERSDPNARCRGGHPTIDLVNRDGTRRRALVRLTALGPSAQIRLQSWSNDGRILYLASTPDRDLLYSIASSGTNTRVVARSSNAGRLGGASWSPDGLLIALKRRCKAGSHDDVYCDLAVMRGDGTSVRTILRHSPAPHGPSDESPTWLRETSRLIVAEWGFDADTRRVDAGAGTSRVIAKEPWRDVTASTDGKTIGFVYDVSGGGLFLGLARLDGTIVARRKLPFGGAGSVYDLWLS